MTKKLWNNIGERILFLIDLGSTAFTLFFEGETK